jgi:hypothetical protein
MNFTAERPSSRPKQLNEVEAEPRPRGGTEDERDDLKGE